MNLQYKWSSRLGKTVKEANHTKPTLNELQEAIDNNGILRRDENTLFVKNFRDGWDEACLLVQKTIWNGLGSNIYVDCYKIEGYSINA